MGSYKLCTHIITRSPTPIQKKVTLTHTHPHQAKKRSDSPTPTHTPPKKRSHLPTLTPTPPKNGYTHPHPPAISQKRVTNTHTHPYSAKKLSKMPTPTHTQPKKVTLIHSNPLRRSVKIGALKVLQNSQETACARVSFLIETPWHRYFPVKFAKILRAPFFTERLWLLLLSVWDAFLSSGSD